MAPDAPSLLQHAAGIRALLRGLLADEASIDDVLQETWVAALAKGPRAGVPLGPWLKRVAINFARRLRRGDARRTARERAAARPDETPESRFDIQREVVDELARLDEPYRSTLILSFFEGLSPAEIAQQRGMPAATARSHLKRGLERIRERLDRTHGSRGAWGAAFLPWLATRNAAAATGVIVMSVKTKLALVAALALAMVGATSGVIVWRESSGPSPTARTASARGATAQVPTKPESGASGTPPAPVAERSLVLHGRIVEAGSKRVLANTAVHIALSGEERNLDLVTDDSGEFSGTSAILSESSRWSLFRAPKTLFRYLSIEVEGYAVRRSPEGSLTSDDKLDLGEIEVARGVPVGGRVVRRDRTGISGAILLLSFEHSALFPPAYALPVGLSGADGVFLLDKPLPVSDRGWPWVLMAIGGEGFGSQMLEVLPGQDRIDSVEVVIDSAAPLDVTVTDSEGGPLPNAYVRVEPRFAPLMEHYKSHSHSLWVGRRADVLALFNGRTDDQGRVALAQLPLPGPYDVVAAAAGYALGWQDDVEVARGQRRSVTLRLERHRLCAVSGTVHDEDGTPIAGAAVGPRGQATVATDNLGRFRVEGLEPGWDKVWFVATAEGFAKRDREVQLARDRDIEEIEIRLVRALPINGRVVDQEGRPVAGVYLDLLRNGEQIRPDADKSEADGRFAFSNATAGPWKLRVIAPQDHPEWEDARELEIRGGDTGIEVVLRRLRLGATKLVGRVVEAATGKPLDPTHALVMRRDFKGPTEYARPSLEERRSGEVGAERLHPDEWRLWVHVPGYAPAFVDFTVVEGQAEARIEVRMGHSGRIVGRVKGIATTAMVWTLPAGSDLAPGSEYEAHGRIRGGGQVGEDGAFTIENLAPGPTEIKLDADGFIGTAKVNVPSGGDAHVEITATPAARLRFRTKDPVPGGTEVIRSYVAQGADDWRLVMSLGGVAGKRLCDEETFPAGRTRWRVVFECNGRVRTQEGVVDLAVGQTTEVIVPIEFDR